MRSSKEKNLLLIEFVYGMGVLETFTVSSKNMAWLWRKRKRFEAPILIGRTGASQPDCGNRISSGGAFSRAKFGKYDAPHFGIKILKKSALWGTLIGLLSWLAWESLPAIGLFQ
ncbi:MAG TPA: hypothetical protein PLV25_02345 [Opitutales bacterium]|nr:hypothetical protein [Opitutales bacterium]